MSLSSFSGRLLRVIGSAADYLSNRPVFTGVCLSLLAVALLAMDFAAPPYIEFAVVYAIMIAATTQFVGWQLGLALAGALPVSHLLLYALIGAHLYPPAIELVNMLLLFFAGLATVYLLHLARHMEELRQANLRLETLQQTMVTVNDIVLNRLQVMQFMIHLAEQGKPLATEQIQLGKNALDEVAAKLRELSQLSHYETTEVTSGVRAVRIPGVTAKEVTAKGAAGKEVAAEADPA